MRPSQANLVYYQQLYLFYFKILLLHRLRLFHQLQAISDFAESPETELEKIDSSENVTLGQVYDPENELYYYNRRYYDPSIGNFTTPDTYIDGNDTLMGFNRYAYVHGNPVKYTDPSGNFIITAIVSAVVGAVVGGVAAGSKGFTDFENFDWAAAAKGAGIGAIAGFAGGAAGWGAGAVVGALGGKTAGIVAGATFGGAFGGATSGALYAATTPGVGLDAIWKGALAGAAGGFVGGGLGGYLGGNVGLYSGAIAGGATGGAVGAALNGGNPWLGALTGAAAGLVGAGLAQGLEALLRPSAPGLGSGEGDADMPGEDPLLKYERAKIRLKQGLKDGTEEWFDIQRAVKKNRGRDWGDRLHPVKPGKIQRHRAADVAGRSDAGKLYGPYKAGRVIASRNTDGGYGNYLVIRHSGNIKTLYGHNSRNLAPVGAYVRPGDPIAIIGSTGNSTGPHIHFEVRGGYNGAIYIPKGLFND